MLHFTRLAVIVAAIALLSACAGFTTRINPEPRMEDYPPTTKKALHAGVYYSPEFANHEQTRVGGPHKWIATIGAASVRMFDELIPRVFEETSRLSSVSTNEMKSRGIDLVISPSLVHFDFRLGTDSDSDRYSVGYRTTLYSTEGVPVASWVVVGNAATVSMFSLKSSLWGWIESDMNDAAAKFLRGFEHNAGPALMAITRESKGLTVPVDPSSVVLTARRAELAGFEPEIDQALRDAGMLAIRLTAQGTTGRDLTVRASDTRLRLGDGQTIEPSTVNSVLSVLDQTSQAGAAAAVIGGSLVGLLVSISEDRARQAEREAQYGEVARSLFLDRTLGKGTKETGIVPFLVPKGSASVGQIVLRVWVVDPSSAEGALIEVPVTSDQ